MIRTRVGYAGGKKAAPTYQSLGGHSETIQIDYDPSIISYAELLDIYPGDFVDSTLAARLNGYVGGYGTLEALQAEFDNMGLPQATVDGLLEALSAFENRQVPSSR